MKTPLNLADMKPEGYLVKADKELCYVSFENMGHAMLDIRNCRIHARVYSTEQVKQSLAI